MDMQFEFSTAEKILFGEGVSTEVPELAFSWGQQILVVTGRSTLRATPLMKELSALGASCLNVRISGEPTVQMLQESVEEAREAGCEVVIGIGGGGALDAAKVIAAMLTNDGEVLEYLERVGDGRRLTTPSAPMIAIPTTAGTGSEVTKNAVLLSEEHGLKVSMRDDFLFPRLAVVDPCLTYSMPPVLTAMTGFDALTQLIEPYVSGFANPMTDALCHDGLLRCIMSLGNAVAHSHDITARRDMSLASLYGGIVLANAKLGAVHAFASVIGGILPAPHGAICARLLPHVMRANIRALEARDSGHPALHRYDEIAQIMTGDVDAKAMDGVEWVEALLASVEMPSLATYELCDEDFADLIALAKESGRMKGNPIVLTDDELYDVLEKGCAA